MSALFVKDIFGDYIPADSEIVINEAKKRIAAKCRRGAALTSPTVASDYFRLQLAEREHEVFAVLLLDNQHRILEFVELFRGTIDGAAVYPREVVKLALNHNAAAVMFAHNHPSGIAEPSEADKQITRVLKNALSQVEIRTLDHFVVGSESVFSFAANGLL